MSISAITLALVALGALTTAGLAVALLRNEDGGLALAGHDRLALPRVMADRYAAFSALSLGALWFGHMGVIAFLFSIFALMGFSDAAIYRSAGKAPAKHLMDGVAAALVAAVAFAAMKNGAHA